MPRSLISILDLSIPELDGLIATANDIIEYLEADPANEENVTRIKNYLAVYGAKA